MNYSNNLLKIIENGSTKIQGIEKNVMSIRPAAGKWSKKEILGHLVDSGVNNYQRIMTAQLKEDLIFQGYDQEQWVKMNDYQSRDVVEILALWDALNRHIAYVIATIPQFILERKTTQHSFDLISMKPIPKGEASSLSYLIWDYIFHLEHHLAQILEGYQNQNSDFKP